jgi:hypothetical protein
MLREAGSRFAALAKAVKPHLYCLTNSESRVTGEKVFGASIAGRMVLRHVVLGSLPLVSGRAVSHESDTLSNAGWKQAGQGVKIANSGSDAKPVVLVTSVGRQAPGASCKPRRTWGGLR